MQQKATVGRIVHVLLDPEHNNGADVAPAIITRVWGEPYTPGTAALERQTVNVNVFGDSHAEPIWLTSIWVFDERPTDEQLAALNQSNPKGYRAVAFWPPRI